MGDRRKKLARRQNALQKQQQPPAQKLTQQELERIVQAYNVTEIHQGPLPHPQLLRAYDALVQNGAERIFRQMELNAEIRRECERRESRSLAWSRLLPPVLGFVLIMACLSAGFYLSVKGYEAVGIVAVVSSVSLPVVSYIAPSLKRQSENKSKKFQLEIPFGS